jgi:hypothetical protein
MIFSRPLSWIRISLVFLLCALPVVSIGWAWGIALTLALDEIEGRRLYCFAAIRKYINRRGMLFFLMGVMDILFLAMLFFSLRSLLEFKSPASGFISAFFVWCDLAFLFSGILRYPLAVCDDGLSLGAVLVKGLILTAQRPGGLILVFMAMLTVLILCSATALFLPFYAPGAIALLAMESYLNK